MPTQSAMANRGGNVPINPPAAPPVSPFLALLPRSYWGRRKDFFTYVPANGPVNLAASAVKAATTIQINADSDFVLMAISGIAFSTDDTTILTDPPFDIALQDGVTTQFLSSDMVHWGTIVGSAREPFFLPYPRLIGANGLLSILLTNLSATARHVNLSFHGFKIFPQAAAQ